MNRDSDPQRFRRFVARRRKWFWIVFGGALIPCHFATSGKSDSLVEIVGFALAGALIAATILSLAAIPVVWWMSGRRRSS